MNDLLYEIGSIFRKGGWVLIPLFILSQSAWILCFKQWWVLKKHKFSTLKFLTLAPKNNQELLHELNQNQWLGALSKICQSALQGLKNNNLEESIKIKTKEIQFSINKSIKTIAIISKSLPLLGLFGTVQGIKITFDIIQEYGNGNSSIISSGISTALITTQSSLILAIPLILFHNYLINQIRNIESDCIESANKILVLNNQLKS